jgi:hypothetical protein
MFQTIPETLKQACPEEMLNQVQHDTFRVQGDSHLVSNIVMLNLFQHLIFFYTQISPLSIEIGY